MVARINFVLATLAFLMPTASLSAPPVKFAVVVAVQGSGTVTSSAGSAACITDSVGPFKQGVRYQSLVHIRSNGTR